MSLKSKIVNILTGYSPVLFSIVIGTAVALPHAYPINWQFPVCTVLGCYY